LLIFSWVRTTCLRALYKLPNQSTANKLQACVLIDSRNSTTFSMWRIERSELAFRDRVWIRRSWWCCNGLAVEDADRIFCVGTDDSGPDWKNKYGRRVAQLYKRNNNYFVWWTIWRDSVTWLVN
jgi:hypothetical protein